MRIAQERTPAGCLWALAAGWLAISLVMQKDLFLDYVVVGLMAGGALFLTIYRLIYPDAFLVTEAAPEPGQPFRGKIETPLKSEPPSAPTVRMTLIYSGRKVRRTIWQSAHEAHPIRGEHGIILPVEFSIPAEVAKEINQNCNWTLSAWTNGRPWLYRAVFTIAAPRNQEATA